MVENGGPDKSFERTVKVMAMFGKLSATVAILIAAVPCAGAATPAYDSFASEAVGLLSPSAGARLTAQANSSKGPVATIQPFRTAEALRGYKTIFDGTIISIRKYDDSGLLEVLVAVADAPGVRAKKAGGANNLAALAKSTIWVSVARRRVPWDAISADGTLVFEKVEKDVMSMCRDAMETLLLAF